MEFSIISPQLAAYGKTEREALPEPRRAINEAFVKNSFSPIKVPKAIK